jgi:hypothetical protein
MLSYTLMGIIIKNLDEFEENDGFIMDFWHENVTFVTQRKWEMWTQKIHQSSVKIKIRKQNIIKWIID